MDLSPFPFEHADLMQVEDCIWVLTAPTGIGNYDFRFAEFFNCHHSWEPPTNIAAVARLGAFPDYDVVFSDLRTDGITLVNSPDDYRRATELPGWYPLIADLTPRSICFAGQPNLDDVISQLSWPIFMKGSRQTSRHRRALSIIDGAEQFKRVIEVYATDPILRSQGIVCREYVPLRLIEDTDANLLPSAFEFRTFWWKGELAGCGRYWWLGKPYGMTADEEKAGLAVAQ